MIKFIIRCLCEKSCFFCGDKGVSRFPFGGDKIICDNCLPYPGAKERTAEYNINQLFPLYDPYTPKGQQKALKYGFLKQKK